MSNPTNSRLKHGFKVPLTQFDNNLNDTQTSSTTSISTSSKKTSVSDSSASKSKNSATPKTDSKETHHHHTTGSSLKSSVKRLFSPSSSTKAQTVPNLTSSTSVPSSSSSKKPTKSSKTGISLSNSSKSLSNSANTSHQQINSNPSIENTSINSYSSSTIPSNSTNTSTFITTNNILENSATINSPYITTASIASRSFNNTSNLHDTSDNTLSSINDSSIRSVSSKAENTSKNTSSIKTKESSILSSTSNSKATTAMAPVESNKPQTRSATSAGGTLKKHLNILKTSSKKALMGSASSPATIPSSCSLSGGFSKPSLSKKPSITSSSTSPKSLNNMTASLLSADTISSKDSSYSLATSNAEHSQQVIDELRHEIEKLRFELNRYVEDEDIKLGQFKRIAEEKQIESAALKYEFRKLQDMKENLSAENNLFKSFLTSINLNPSNLPSSSSLNNKISATKNRIPSGSSSPLSSSVGSPRKNNLSTSNSSGNINLYELNSAQQAAAVAAAAAAVNAHTHSNFTPTASNLETGSGSFENQSRNNHYHHQQQQQQQQQQQLQQAQYYHLNATRSLSPGPQPKPQYTLSTQQLPPPPPPPPGHPSLTPTKQNQLQTTSSSSLVNANLKQQQQMQQFQQQQNNVVAAATAAAEFYEQQMKLQQSKNLDLEQQFRAHAKESKESINNLNEMNRKLYEENQQYKERNIEQRQQIEHYHSLYQESQQKSEHSLNQIRKERDEALQNEADLKRHMQLALDSKQQESLQAAKMWKEKFEDIKESEIRLSQELTMSRTQLQNEKSKAELLEKKCKALEKDCSSLKENWDTEKSSMDDRISSYDSQMDLAKKQFAIEVQKLDEKYRKEKDELLIKLKDMETRVEEVLREKNQISHKYGQLVENNRDLNNLCQSKENTFEKKQEELNSKLEFYMNKCNDLEKEISDVQEGHARDTEEWKKFQADLQTAVRVANDFMMEAEEKMNKMKDDYELTKQKEAHLSQEVERLRKKLTCQELLLLTSKSQSYNYSKQNKENEELQQIAVTPISYYNSNKSTDLIDTTNIVLTPLQINNPTTIATVESVMTNPKLSISHRHNSSGHIGTETPVHYIPKRDLNSANFDSVDLVKKPVNSVRATSSSSLMDSANLNSNSLLNSDALANLVKQYGVSKRNALIKWCQERMIDYKDIDIKNFSSSWNDGLAFCALLHSFMPNKIDYDALRAENNPRKNFQTAFRQAQNVGIQQTLNINDLINNERPDWNNVMNYVTLIYKHFQGQETGENKSELKKSSTNGIHNFNQDILAANTMSIGGSAKTTGRSSSSSPTTLRNLASSVQNTLPFSLSASTTSTTSNASSFSASSSSSSISKTIN